MFHFVYILNLGSIIYLATNCTYSTFFQGTHLPSHITLTLNLQEHKLCHNIENTDKDNLIKRAAERNKKIIVVVIVIEYSKHHFVKDNKLFLFTSTERAINWLSTMALFQSWCDENTTPSLRRHRSFLTEFNRSRGRGHLIMSWSQQS